MSPEGTASKRGKAGSRFPGIRRVVVKLGSGTVTDPEKGLRETTIRALAAQLSSAWTDAGVSFVVVTSGAIAAGRKKLGMTERPRTVALKQAAAAVGQTSLMRAYERAFEKRGRHVAQLLLTHEDFEDRERYVNARNTLLTLLSRGIVPIVNENDTVAVEEMKFGDNDHLSALVATLLEADLLVILSDVEGVYDRDPRVHADARVIPLIQDMNEVKEAIMGESRSALGTGGIVTKIDAAEKAAAAGIATVITTGLRPGVLTQVFDAGEELGTLVLPEENRLTHRKHWIAYNLKPAGEIVVDTGAYDALVNKKKSLLPSGLKEVRGSFGAGECVRCLDHDGREFARGLVNYSTQELNRIKGLHTSNIEKVLGYKAYDEIIHRDDLVLL